MRSAITAKRIGAGSTFKLLFLGFVVFHVTSTVIVMLLTAVGILPLESTYADTGVATTPMLFLLAYLAAGLVLSPLWVGTLWLSIWPGLWLYSLVRPTRISYVAVDDAPDA